MATKTGPHSTKIAVTLPNELVDRLRSYAASRGVGLSTLVRMLLSASMDGKRP